ncbi:hypothetical protein Ctha_2519 [Chloroherpeton thalassium ATCC 35110]|uniref:DUF86 domain-containing protein n=1 Tax=Chloroherpeton thalassium (strain ATCC 35110 / GB-78) TaxID=517418 RepID=B3QXQ3_CHLT3|nr:hypothetical protein Ctha_2519 [Chloroherpeton thalassium ATCC 35110]
MKLLKTEDWLCLRKIRNSIAHEYDANLNNIIEGLNEICNSFDNVLLNNLEKVYHFSKSKFMIQN